MSARRTMNEIDRIVIGIETQQAVDLTLDYIRKRQHFNSAEAAHDFWATLSDNEKVDILTKALRQ